MKIWFTSPIKAPAKGQFKTIVGYAVVRGFGKDRETAIKFTTANGHTPETAYTAASDLATFLNIANQA